MSKRKIVALILFIFVSLFMFSFASPRGIGIKKNNNVPEKEIFTVVFKNYDGTILDEQTIEKGNSASYQGETPKRPNSKICNYEFTGWSDSIQNVTSNIDVVAQYNCEKRSYVVRFMDDDKVTLLATDKVNAGGTAIYSGKTPTKINHVFNGWNDTLSNILSNKTVYATYYADYNHNDIDDAKEDHYNITFKAGENGSLEGTTTYTNILTGLTFEQANIIIPTPVPNKNYKFKEWTPKINKTVSASVEYTAEFYPDFNNNNIDDREEEHYTIEFLAGEHGILEGTTTYENILTGLTFEQANIVIPKVKANENYKANGWDKEINTTVTEDATYTAQYFADFNNNDIDDETERVTVIFYAGEHGIIGNSKEYIVEGLLPGYDNYPEAPNIDVYFGYGFKAWNPNYNANTMIPLENASLEFTATYFEDKNHNGIDDETEDHYTVKFNAGLHGTLEGQTTYENILTGLTFSEAGIVIPTINANENYKANGWDKEINTKVTENATYTAQYFADFNNNDIDDETEKVTVKFYKGEYGNFKEGSTTEYPNLLPGYDNYPEAPEVVANDNYSFKAWHPNYNANTMIPLENASLEFTATYFEDKNHNGIDDETEEHYTVEFLAGTHGTLEGQTTYENILTGLTFSEAGIVIPTINANENYKANGWDKEINTTVIENATYTAQYFADFNNNGIDDESEKVTITFEPGEHGNFAENSQTSYVLLPGYDNYPEAPEVIANNKYEHTGWTPTLPLGQIAITVNSDITYTATYTKTTADITVNVTSNITRNGTAVAGSIVEYGDKINYTITIKNNDTVDGSVNLKNIINGNLDTTDLPEEYKALLTNEGYTVNVTANNTVTIEFSLTVKANVNETVRVDLTYSVDGNGTNTIEGTEYNTEKTITIIEKTETVNGTNIVIVIDRSASMDGNRIEKAKEATNSFIDKVFTKNSNTHGSTVTVVTFGTNAKWVGGLLFGGYEHTPYANQIGITATDYNTAQNLKKAVNNIKNQTTNPGGSGTPYFKELEKAYGILYDETTGLSTNGNQNAVIFLSDGAPDDTDNVTSRKNIINNLKDKNTIMYTIGFGVTKDSDAHKVLKNVAYDNADNTYLAKDDGTNDLVNVFSAISSKIADENKSKQTTKGVAEIGQTVVADATHQIIVKVNGTETYKFNSLEEALTSGVITSNTTGYKVNATKFQAGDKIEVSYYASIS